MSLATTIASLALTLAMITCLVTGQITPLGLQVYTVFKVLMLLVMWLGPKK